METGVCVAKNNFGKKMFSSLEMFRAKKAFYLAPKILLIENCFNR